MPRPCGHDDCSVSTGIHDGLTFGRGHLDENGFFDIPCATCARHAEARDGKPVGTYWPFNLHQAQRLELAARSRSDNVPS